MNSFRFRLEKVLEWRQTQLQIEECRFQEQAAAVSALDRARAELRAESVRAEAEIRSNGQVEGQALSALAAFRDFVKRKEAGIAARRVESAQVLESRRSAMLEARRRLRLLERLRERRLQEWMRNRDREIDNLASESFLAKWSAQDKEPRDP